MPVPVDKGRRRAVLAIGLLASGTLMAAEQTVDNVVKVRRIDPALLLQLSAQLKRQYGAAAEPIGVLFPDIGEPFRKVFTEIISGIEEQTKSHVRTYPIGASQDGSELAAQIKRDGTRVLIALGRQGVKAAGSVDSPLGVIVSGVLSVPDNDKQNGISLTPDPALLFSHLKDLIPQARRVIVVYNPSHNDWLLKLARDAARSNGLELLAYEARDLASAARLYETAFAAADPRQDAVWLPQDPTTVDETTILPLVLRESWNRSVPVFSSSFVHVKKGALFALSPNNVELGRTLGGIAMAALAGDAPRRGMAPLREVYTALNLRTASHIGLNIASRVQRNFDFLFPEP